ncbi:MAG: transcriptional repressor [Patescibacteria group bacterium]|nr:transcriptional repressor [Patescibacteria group bacterium]
MTAEAKNNGKLAKAGLRRTAGRHRLFALLDEGRAWTARELHARLREKNLATVYRNLQALLKKGLLTEVSLRGHEARYELAERPHHAHLVCGKCRRAECVPCPIRLTASHHLELDGLCTACRR